MQVEGPSFRKEVLPAHAAALGISMEEARRRYEDVYATHRLSTGADVAAAVLFLVSDRARQITGVDLPVDGGWSTL